MAPPGLLWVNSKITSPQVSKDSFNKWYNQVHIPDIFASQGIESACRYKSSNSSADHPYLALYPIKDLDFLTSAEFQAIPRTSTDHFPGPTHLCSDYAHFTSRIYEHVETYEPDPVVSGPGKFIICSGLTPARGTDADFNAWYSKEHYRTVSGCTGFVRTRRYRVSKGADPGLPAYLTLHEFDGESLPEDELAKTAATEWAKRVLGGLEAKEVNYFTLINVAGVS